MLLKNVEKLKSWSVRAELRSDLLTDSGFAGEREVILLIFLPLLVIMCDGSS